MRKLTLGQKLFGSFWAIFAIMAIMAAGFYADVIWLNTTFKQIGVSFEDVSRFDRVFIQREVNRVTRVEWSGGKKKLDI